jgi:YHS domain-containing protein
MKKAHVVTVLSVAVAFAFGLASAYAQTEQGKPKQEGEKKVEKKVEEKGEKKAEKPAMPLCPVSGKPIDFGVSVMAEDGPVYFCCPACPEKYKADTKKFADKVAEQRKALAAMPKVQVTCPVSGKMIDKKVFIEKDGKKIYFCCKDCPAPYEKDPAKYAAKLAGAYTYQTKCPVTGEDISPGAFATLDTGMKIYFCCGGCIPKFEKDPAKYTPKLKEQGITLDPAKIKIVKSEMGKGECMDEGKGEAKGKDKPKEMTKEPAKEMGKEKAKEEPKPKEPGK